MADRFKLAAGLRNLPETAREDLAGYPDGFSNSKVANYLRNAGEQGAGIAKSVARGVPQMATGFVDLAAMPLEYAGVLQPGQAVGSTKWLEEKGYLPPPQEGFINQTVEGLSSALDPSAMAAHALPAIGMLGKTVWHGSPHSFEKFDLSKIGTGEGAQAYGHGLYLADRQGEAMKYAPRDMAYEEKLMKHYSAAEKANDYPTMQIYEDFLTQKTPDEVMESLAEAGFQGKDLEKAQKALANATGLYQNQTASHMYKVDLPDEQIAKMIDYYKPIAEQPEAYAAFQKYAHETQANPEMALKQLQEHTGAEAYGMWNNPEGISQFLKEQGVPGIKYTEQRYVAKPNLTPDYNYVVFDENLPQVLERNNQPVAQALRNYETPKQTTLQDVVAPIEQRGVTLDVYESNKKPLMTLSRIEVPKEMRGQGVGTQAMQDLVNYANQQGKTIALSPSADFGGTSVNRLKDFYKQFGFVENKGRNKDFEISESMYRLPETE